MIYLDSHGHGLCYLHIGTRVLYPTRLNETLYCSVDTGHWQATLMTDSAPNTIVLYPKWLTETLYSLFFIHYYMPMGMCH